MLLDFSAVQRFGGDELYPSPSRMIRDIHVPITRPQLFLVLTLFGCLTARSQDPLTTLPANYHLIFDNSYVRVIQCHYPPHAKLPLHDHPPTPTVYVYLSDSGPVRFSHVEAHPFSIVRQPVKPGEFRVSPGRIEKHQVENLGDIASDFLRIELKTVPLGVEKLAFRDRTTFDKPGLHTEFSSDYLSVYRVMTGSDAGVLWPGAHPALLVAFGDVSLSTGERLPFGRLSWIKPPVSIAGRALVIMPKEAHRQ